MSIEDIRSLRNAKPFRPFEIVLRDGRVLPVALPERIAIAPWGQVGVYVKSTPYAFRIEDVSEVHEPAAR